MAQANQANPTPEKLVADLLVLLNLEPRPGDRFIGQCRELGTGRVFGGQAIAQALGAASRTVDPDRDVHSLHAYFLRAGDDNLEIEYRVKRDLEGRSFSNRRVVACQNGVPILNLVASFQKRSRGLSHQHCTMPDVPPPEDLVPDSAISKEIAKRMPEGTLRTLMMRPQPVDFRSVEPRDWLNPQKRDPVSHVWFRMVAPLPTDMALHRAVLAYISDFQLLATTVQPYGKSIVNEDLRVASLDHAVWFHDDFAVDDWLLYVTESPWSGNHRAFGRGQVFSRDGRLVASVAQEGMARHLDQDG